MKYIVKRAGHSEEFDERKLFASIYASVVAVHETGLAAELVADDVCKHVKKWLLPKHEVLSNDIRRVAGQHLKLLKPDAAYLYLRHRGFGS